MNVTGHYAGILDVSHWEAGGSVVEAVTQGGVGMLIAKATQGIDAIDPAYRTFLREVAKLPDVLVGDYHFGSDSAPGARQNDWYRANSMPGVLKCLDHEPNPNRGGTMSLANAEEWAVRHHASTGVWPVYYSFPAFIRELRISKASPLVNCPLWLADYAPTMDVPEPWTFGDVPMWQFRGGTVTPEAPGLPVLTPGFGQADRSVSMVGDGTEAAFRAWVATQLRRTV